MISQLSNDLWISTAEMIMPGGIDLGARMTIIRLGDDDLFIHSPVKLDVLNREFLEKTGTVRYVVSPSKIHHLYAKPYFDAYPQAKFFAAPGLEEKRKDLGFNGVLSDETPASWVGQIDQHVLKGIPYVNEVVFFHRKSRTLIVTDLCFNVQKQTSFLSKLFHKINKSNRFGPSRIFRSTIRNKVEFKKSIDHILSWDFDRIIMAHGEAIETGGKAAFREAFKFLDNA